MPSKAHRTFYKNLKDVYNLAETYATINEIKHEHKRGRRHLGHLTKGGIILLSGAWEVYVEDLLIETVEFITKNSNEPSNLPDKFKGKICEYVNQNPHNLKALSLCNGGWKQTCMEIVEKEINGLNTPRAHKVQSLYDAFFDNGITKILAKKQEIAGVKKYIPKDSYFKKLDELVNLRCEYAHARSSIYTSKKVLNGYIDTVKQCVNHMETNICQGAANIVGKSPWR